MEKQPQICRDTSRGKTLSTGRRCWVHRGANASPQTSAQFCGACGGRFERRGAGEEPRGSVLETITVLDMPEVSFCRDMHTSPCHGPHLWCLGINGSNMLHIDKKIRSDIAQGICIVYSENAHFKNPIRRILPLGYRQWFPLKTEVCVVEGNP